MATADDADSTSTEAGGPGTSAAAPPDAPAPITPRPPFPGLRPFTVEETDLFFGRDAQTEELLERLDDAHFLAVLGASGCGKSSLVRAGLIAQLEAGFMPRAGARWQVVELRPGDRPFGRLAAQLVDKGVVPRHATDSVAVQTAVLETRLREGPLALGEVLAARGNIDPPNLLVLIDQFEEIFRYHVEKNADEADAFVALLLATATAAEQGLPWSRIYIALTMRSDFLGDCMLFSGLTDAINRGLYVVPELQRDELQLAIEGPCRVTGTLVEPALVAYLLNETGARGDQLPLLQHALMRLWNLALDDPACRADDGRILLRLDDYKRRLGSIGKALNDHADETMREVGDDELVRSVFTAITGRAGHGRDTRRPTTVRDITALAGPRRYWTDIEAVANAFRAPTRNFLVPARPEVLQESTFLDIGHESLIRQWTKLASWVREEDELATELRRAVDAARLRQQGDALWGPSGIERSQRWRSRHAVDLWALRYVSAADYAMAVQFLADSEVAIAKAREDERLAQLQALENERRQRRRRLRDAGALLLMFAVVSAAALAYWGIELRNKDMVVQASQRSLANAEAANRRTEDRLRESDRKLQDEVAKANQRAIDLQNLAKQIEGTERIAREQERKAADAVRTTIRERAEAEKAKGLAQDARDAATRAEETVRLANAKKYIIDTSTSNDPGFALAATMAALSINGKSEIGRHELRRRYAAWPDAQASSPLRIGAAGLAKLHDGGLLWLVAGSPPRIFGEDDQPAARQIDASLPAPAQFDSRLIAFSAVSHRLVLARPDAERKETDLHLLQWGAEPRRWTMNGTVRQVLLDPAGTALLVIDDNDRAVVQALPASGELPAPVPASDAKRKVRLGAFHPQQPWLVLADAEGQLWAVNRADGREVRVAGAKERREVRTLAFSPQGGLLAVSYLGVTGTGAGSLFTTGALFTGADSLDLWRWLGGTSDVMRPERSLMARAADVMRVSADGQFVAAWSANERILRVIDLSAGWDVVSWNAPQSAQQLRDIAFRRQGSVLLSLWGDGNWRRFDLDARPRMRSAPLATGDDEVIDASFSPSREHAALVLDTLPSSTAQVALRALDSLGPDGRWLARFDTRQSVAVIDTRSRELRHRVQLPPDVEPSASAIGGNGSILAIGTSDGSVLVVDARDGRPLGRTRVNAGARVDAITIASQGSWLAWGDREGAVGTYDWASGTQAVSAQKHGRQVRDVAISPDGTLVASGADDNVLRLWRVRQVERNLLNTPLRQLLTRQPEQTNRALAPHNDWVMALAFSPDGKSLVTGADDGEVRLWNIADGTYDRLAPGGGLGVRDVAFAPDGRSIGVSVGSSIRWLTRAGTPVREWPSAPPFSSSHLRFDDKGGLLALGRDRSWWSLAAEDPAPRIQNVGEIGRPPVPGAAARMVRLPADGRTPAPERLSTSGIRKLVLGADGKRMLSIDPDGIVRLTETGRGGALAEVRPEGGTTATALALAPDGQHLAVGFSDGSIATRGAASGAELRTVKAHQGRVLSVAYSPDGRLLASGGEDNAARLWSPDTLAAHRRGLLQHQGSVYSVSFVDTAGGLELLTAENTRVRLWPLDSEKLPRQWTVAAARTVGASPGGRLLVITEGTQVRIYNARWPSNTPLASLSYLGGGQSAAGRRIERAVFDADGRRILALLNDGAVHELPCRVCIDDSNLMDWGRRTARPLTEEETQTFQRSLTD